MRCPPRPLIHAARLPEGQGSCVLEAAWVTRSGAALAPTTLLPKGAPSWDTGWQCRPHEGRGHSVHGQVRWDPRSPAPYQVRVWFGGPSCCPLSRSRGVVAQPPRVPLCLSCARSHTEPWAGQLSTSFESNITTCPGGRRGSQGPLLNREPTPLR